ncbi:MAG: GAF domain-containing protein [Chloroflexota bacterium]|nr:GAF domain-containing protein [Chloroflexota bacterium]
MQEPSTWREALSGIISDTAERERIANEVGVRSITLARWANGSSLPRPQNLRHLLNALPKQHRSHMQELLEEAFSDLATIEIEHGEEEISYKFILEVFDIRATIADQLRFWTITRQVLQQALRQLDPEQVGMAITVVRCMPPSANGKILSLRESAGLGSAPWGGDLEEKALFLGAESLAGYAVTTCRPAPIQNLQEDRSFLPAYQTENEVSAIAYPIMFASRIAGCLLISSTEPNYFLSRSRTALIHSYANLVGLAFEPEEFYPPEIIQLRMMPDLETQRKYFTNFRQRVLALLRGTGGPEHSLNTAQAELRAWQQLEEALLQL